MISLTPEADAHLARLTAHYERLTRLEAAENLLAALEAATLRIAAVPEGGLEAPRSYKGLSRLGFRWIIERDYWIAYTKRVPPQIAAIFHATANIPGWF